MAQKHETKDKPEGASAGEQRVGDQRDIECGDQWRQRLLERVGDDVAHPLVTRRRQQTGRFDLRNELWCQWIRQRTQLQVAS